MSSSGNDSCILAIIGDGSVGKSCLISAFRDDNFEKIYKQTVGCDFYEKVVTLAERTVSLRVWDIGGQSMNSKNLPQYLSSSDLVFIVYDVTNSESFANVEDWLDLSLKYSPQANIHIVGNKVDLLKTRQVSASQHNNFVLNRNEVKGGMFMSAKTGENVVKAFYKASSERLGIKLSAYELGFYDKVLVAHVEKDDDDEERTAYIERIEREDREAEARKKSKIQGPCICS